MEWQKKPTAPKTVDDLRAKFANFETWHEDDPEWDEIRQLHQQLISLETRRKNIAENSIDRFLRTLKLVGIKQSVINQPTLFWLLEDCANKNLGKIPIYRPFSIENGVMKGEIWDDQIMGFLIWLNLLESAHPNNPVPISSMTDIIRWRNGEYENLDRRKELLEVGVIDEFGNIKPEAIEQSAINWAYWKKKRKHLDDLLTEFNKFLDC